MSSDPASRAVAAAQIMIPKAQSAEAGISETAATPAAWRRIHVRIAICRDRPDEGETQNVRMKL